MNKKKLKKENNKMLEQILKLEHKLNMANSTVCKQINEIESLAKRADDRIEALQKINTMTENHLQISERELQAKERLIIDHKEWISDLIKVSN